MIYGRLRIVLAVSYGLAGAQTNKGLRNDLTVTLPDVETHTPTPFVVTRCMTDHQFASPYGFIIGRCDARRDRIAILRFFQFRKETAQVSSNRLIIGIRPDVLTTRVSTQRHGMTRKDSLDNVLALGGLMPDCETGCGFGTLARCQYDKCGDRNPAPLQGISP